MRRQVEQLQSRIEQLESENALLREHQHPISTHHSALTDRLLKLHLEHSPLIMIEFDRDFRIRLWSRRAEQSFHWTAEEVLGKRWDEMKFVHLDDVERVRRVCADLISGKDAFNTCTNRNYRRDGGVAHCQWFNSVIRNEDGELISLLSLGLEVSDRVQVEEALRQSEARFKLAVQGFLIGIWEWEIETGNVYWSPRVFEQLGYRQGEISPTFSVFLEHLHPDDTAAVQARLQESLRTGGIYQSEFRLELKSGQYRWFRAKGATERDASGKPVRMAGCLEDIEDKKQSEIEIEQAHRALREIHLRQQLALDAGVIGTWDYEFHEDRVHADERFAKIFSIDAQVAKNGVTLAQILRAVHPDDRHRISDAITDALRNGGTYSAEHRICGVDENGAETVRWVVARGCVELDESGVPVRAPGAVVDITDRRRTEEELEQTRAILSAAIEASPAGIVIADAPDGRIRAANAAAIGVREVSEEDLAGISLEHYASFWRCSHPDGTPYRNEDLPLAKAILEGAVSQNVDVIIERDDGNRQWILGNAAPVRDSAGKVIAGVIVFSDVTEQKNAAKSLRELESELAHVARVSTMGELVGGIAHEINQPLYAIQNFSKASIAHLEGGTQFDRNQLIDWLHEITEAAEHAGKVLARLKEFVRKRPTNMTEVDLEETITKAVSLTQFEAQRKQITVTARLPKGLKPVLADEMQIQQVIVNLIRNAIEAIPAWFDVRQIEILAENVDNEVRVDVADSGKGLPEDWDWKLLQAFSSTKPDGMGLGLAIARTIIELHGGDLWVTKSRGHGAVFSFKIQAAGC